MPCVEPLRVLAREGVCPVRKRHDVDFASLDGISSGFAFAESDIPCVAEPAVRWVS